MWMDGVTTTVRCGGMCPAIVVMDDVLNLDEQNGEGAPRLNVLSIPLTNVRHYKSVPR
jgi:hypothetical protein